MVDMGWMTRKKVSSSEKKKMLAKGFPEASHYTYFEVTITTKKSERTVKSVFLIILPTNNNITNNEHNTNKLNHCHNHHHNHYHNTTTTNIKGTNKFNQNNITTTFVNLG